MTQTASRVSDSFMFDQLVSSIWWTISEHVYPRAGGKESYMVFVTELMPKSATSCPDFALAFSTAYNKFFHIDQDDDDNFDYTDYSMRLGESRL